jgi:hypothetical protein
VLTEGERRTAALRGGRPPTIGDVRTALDAVRVLCFGDSDTYGELAEAIRLVAQERGVLYADATRVTDPVDDGIHLSMDSHVRLAELIASTVMTGLPAT